MTVVHNIEVRYISRSASAAYTLNKSLSERAASHSHSVVNQNTRTTCTRIIIGYIRGVGQSHQRLI